MTWPQNHIHLAKTVDVDGEKAPVYKWRTVERRIIPRVFASIEYTLSGHLAAYTLKDGGATVKYKDMMYVLRIQDDDYGYTVAQRIDQILGMQGELVYLVDHEHMNDGQDHTTAIRQMYCESIGEFIPYSPSLKRYDVEVLLIDAGRKL